MEPNTEPCGGVDVGDGCSLIFPLRDKNAGPLCHKCTRIVNAQSPADVEKAKVSPIYLYRPVSYLMVYLVTPAMPAMRPRRNEYN